MGPRTVGTVDPSTDWTPERSRPGWSPFRGSARPQEITGVSSYSDGCGGASTACRERWEAISTPDPRLCYAQLANRGPSAVGLDKTVNRMRGWG
jgi:hypothetical protein